MRYSTLAIFLTGLTVLLPQGVGFALPGGLPNLDLPRLASLTLIAIFLLRMLRTGTVALDGSPRTLALLAALALWQLVSVLGSVARGTALVWAIGNVVNYWAMAFAFLSLAGGIAHRKRVARAFTLIAILLALWTVGELITQAKLVPVRNHWAQREVVRFSTTLRRVLPGVDITLPLASIGPYASNLSLAAALCAFGGFILVRHNTTFRPHRILALVFLLAILATQSRAGIAAMLVMIVLNAGWGRPGSGRFVPLLAAAMLVVVGWVLLTEAAREGISAVFTSSFQEASTGSIQARLAGLGVLVRQFDRWWAWGYGPGSLFDSDRVVTDLEVYSDPGSFFAFFVESGLPAGVMVTLLLAASLRDGFASSQPDVRAASIGLAGFTVTALISLPPWLWGIAAAQAGLIESWFRAERAVRSSVRPASYPQTVPITRAKELPGSLP